MAETAEMISIKMTDGLVAICDFELYLYPVTSVDIPFLVSDVISSPWIRYSLPWFRYNMFEAWLGAHSPSLVPSGAPEG